MRFIPAIALGLLPLAATAQTDTTDGTDATALQAKEMHTYEIGLWGRREPTGSGGDVGWTCGD